MKNKLITILLLAYSYAGFTQTRSIWFSSSDTVSIGDSAWVEIKYTYTNPSDTCRIYISNSFGLWEVFKMTYGGVDTLKKYHTHTSVNPLDSVTRINFVVPNCYAGQAVYLASNQLPVYINSTTWIQEYNRSYQTQKVFYYNIIGQEISIDNNPNIIGQTIIKVTLTDNTIKTQKIIYENH